MSLARGSETNGTHGSDYQEERDCKCQRDGTSWIQTCSLGNRGLIGRIVSGNKLLLLVQQSTVRVPSMAVNIASRPRWYDDLMQSSWRGHLQSRLSGVTDGPRNYVLRGCEKSCDKLIRSSMDAHLGLPHAQSDSSRHSLSMTRFDEVPSTPLDHAVTRVSDVVQDISDAVDEVMDESDIATLDTDSSDSEEEQVGLSPDQNAYLHSESLEATSESTPLRASGASCLTPPENMAYDFNPFSYQTYDDIAGID